MLNINTNVKTRTSRLVLRMAIAMSFLAASSNSISAQDQQQVILPSREVSVRQAFDEISRQTSYKIAVNWAELDPDRKILASASKLTPGDLLKEVMQGTGYSYELVDNQIALFKVTEEELVPKSLRGAMHGRSFNNSALEFVPDPWSKQDRKSVALFNPYAPNGYWAPERSQTDSLDLVMLHYRVNKPTLERDFMDNAHTMDIIDRTFTDPELLENMDFITMVAASSPEGNTAFNEQLARDRVLAAKSYLMWKYPFLDRDKIYTYSIGEDWSGLRKMVEDDLRTPMRQEILDLLGRNMHPEEKKALLKKIDSGRAYRYIADNMLPYLRGAAACMIYYKKDTETKHIIETQTIEVEKLRVDTVRTVDTVYIDRMIETPAVLTEEILTDSTDVRKPRYMAVKNNLLFDAGLLPNIAFEFSLGRRWSVELEGQWSWWNTETGNHFVHRIQTAGIEVRKWLGKRDKRPLTGHYIGIYGSGGTYDIKFGKTGYLSNGSYSAGITYGYAMPLSRRLNLEFGIGLGYVGGDYDKYKWLEASQCYHWQSSHKGSYFGPTKAKISLVWLIGSGVNEDKTRR